MNKTIEKCEAYKKKNVEAALEKAKAEYEDARGSYNDTGYDRYYNKMTKKEKEIEELEEYLEAEKAIAAAKVREAEAKRWVEDIKNQLENKLFYLLKAIPECPEALDIRLWLEKL